MDLEKMAKIVSGSGANVNSCFIDIHHNKEVHVNVGSAAVVQSSSTSRMKDEYISFETAKLLKECGFPQGSEGKRCFRNGQALHKDVPSYGDWVRVPTQAVAMRWIRETHRINVSVDMGFYDWKGVDGLHWDYKLTRLGNHRLFFLDVELNGYQTYEEAAEEGIKAACEYINQKNK